MYIKARSAGSVHKDKTRSAGSVHNDKVCRVYLMLCDVLVKDRRSALTSFVFKIEQLKNLHTKCSHVFHLMPTIPDGGFHAEKRC